MAYAAPLFTKLESALQYYVDNFIRNFTHIDQQMWKVLVDNYLHPQYSVCHRETFYEFRLKNLRNSYTDFHDNPSNNPRHTRYSVKYN